MILFFIIFMDKKMKTTIRSSKLNYKNVILYLILVNERKIIVLNQNIERISSYLTEMIFNVNKALLKYK